MSNLRNLCLGAVGAAVGACLATTAAATTTNYRAVLNDINNFGASGQVDLRLDDVTNTLAVRVQASGLDPDVPHVQHIHGVKNADGTNGNSITPTAAQDTDGDGFIELGEGRATYGPIIVPLTDITKPGLTGFPTAPGGMIDFSFTYDLLNPATYAGSFGMSDLLNLGDREIVIHGAFTNFAPVNELPGLGGGIDQDMFGNPISAARNYNAALPVLAGTISPVPLPAAGWLLLTGLGGLVALRKRRKS